MKLKHLQGLKTTLSNVVKLPANAWLEYQYGWRSLYNDVSDLATIMPRLLEHKQYLKRTVDEFSSVSNRMDSEVNNTSYYLPPSPGMGTNWDLGLRSKSAKRTCCFSLDVKRDGSASSISDFDHILTGLGTRQVAEALWDLVPFSFVVDWFFHIDKLVSSSNVSWSQFNLRRVGYSTKYQYMYEFLAKGSAQNWKSTIQSPEISLGTFPIYRRYVRTPGIPGGGYTVSPWNSLNVTQLMSGAALIVQRL